MRRGARILLLGLLLAGCASDFEKGVAAAREGRHREARERLDLAIESDAEHRGEALVWRALVAIEEGSLAEAEQDTAYAATFHVDTVRARLALSRAYLERADRRIRRGRIESACEDSERAVALDEGISARQVAARYLAPMRDDVSVGALGSALACADAAIRLAPSRGETLIDRAAIRAALHDKAGALRDVESALPLLERDGRIGQDGRALVLEALLVEETERDEALRLLDVAVHMAPYDGEALTERARLALESGDMKTAEQASLAARMIGALRKYSDLDKILLSPRLPAESARWLALAPDLAEEPEVRAATIVRQEAVVSALFAVTTADKLARDLENVCVDATNVASVWEELKRPGAPLQAPEAFIARVTSARAALRDRVFAVSLSASVEAQLDGQFEAAVIHAQRALDASTDDFKDAVRARRDLLAECAASILAAEAEKLLPGDPWRAEESARRATALHTTPEGRALVGRTEDLVLASRAVYVKALDARREGEDVVVSLQLGAEDGTMPGHPGHLALSVGDHSRDFDVRASDYEVSEVVVGGQSFGWEHTWRSPPIKVGATRAVKIHVRFEPEGARALEATKTLP